MIKILIVLAIIAFIIYKIKKENIKKPARHGRLAASRRSAKRFLPA